MFVCLFVRGKRQNYGTDWRQTLRNYEERPGKCPLLFEIARLSVLGEISRHFRFFVRGRPPFFTSLPSTFGCCLDAKTSKRQNYGTDWRQTLRNYEERHGECPTGVEISRLSTFEKISWHFRFFRRNRSPWRQITPSHLSMHAIINISPIVWAL